MTMDISDDRIYNEPLVISMYIKPTDSVYYTVYLIINSEATIVHPDTELYSRIIIIDSHNSISITNTKTVFF